MGRSSAGASARRRVLPRGFYERATLSVTADLIGKVLVHRTPEGVTAGAIVEAEAYIGESDPACYAAPGPTARNAPLYGPPGVAYVYLNYGMHYLVNAVTEGRGHPAAVLIRALEPLEGIPIMRRNRGIERLGDLARGPGRLTAALQVDRRLDGINLCREGPLWLGHDDHEPGEIGQSIRIGISRDTKRLLRFYLRGSSFVSGPRSLNG